MKFVRRMILPAALTLTLLFVFAYFGGRTGGARAAQSSTCGTWSIIPTPKSSSAYGAGFYGVTAISSSDVWAVGATFQKGISAQVLTEHWDGAAWNVVTTPNAGNSDLYAVSAASTSDIWVVGFTQEKRVTQTLIMHWNGTGWSVVASPAFPHSAVLDGVAAVSANDVWAVGYFNKTVRQPLIEHWDGSAWSVATSPSFKTFSGLNAVTAISPNDVWAVGMTSSSTGDSLPLTEHWNGSTWSTIAGPGIVGGSLAAVTAVPGSNNVWAVGKKLISTNFSYFQTLTEEWNGVKWSRVSSPNPGKAHTDDFLTGVAAISANNVWAVGTYSTPASPLIEQWNGTNWSVIPAPNPGSNSTYLNAITTVPGTSKVWAVGQYQDSNNVFQTFAEFNC